MRSSLSREVPAIVADERTLRQIVMNLLSHSVRHAGPGGQVIVSTSLSEIGEALLRIRDTGHGMTEAEVARALEPFRDLSIASLADRAGTGLGLPLTKALVEANRAALSIRSARGEGTVMTVTIPPTRVLLANRALSARLRVSTRTLPAATSTRPLTRKRRPAIVLGEGGDEERQHRRHDGRVARAVRADASEQHQIHPEHQHRAREWPAREAQSCSAPSARR